MKRSLVVAMTPRFVIGRSGDLPWKLSSDLRRFKQLTMGHHLIMGRKTYESIGRPLPGRTTIIVTRQANYLGEARPPEVLLATSLEQAFSLSASETEVFVVGGGDIYRQALSMVDRMHITWVAAEVAGDTYFPAFPCDAWQIIESQAFPADSKNEYATRYEILERVEPRDSQNVN